MCVESSERTGIARSGTIPVRSEDSTHTTLLAAQASPAARDRFPTSENETGPRSELLDPVSLLQRLAFPTES